MGQVVLYSTVEKKERDYSHTYSIVAARTSAPEKLSVPRPAQRLWRSEVWGEQQLIVKINPRTSSLLLTNTIQYNTNDLKTSSACCTIDPFVCSTSN